MATGNEKEKDRKHDGGDEPPGEFSSSPCYLHEFEQGFTGSGEPRPMAWSAVRKWRREQRRRLQDLRREMSPTDRSRADRAILENIEAAGILNAVDTGIYWPLRGEFDSRPLMRRVQEVGGRVCIPVIVAPDTPLEFWYWDGHAQVRARGPRDIPAPPERRVEAPVILFIPLLGFDTDSHRLGNGGGYFDRTLANMNPRPTTIGIGYGLGRVETIFPQRHDIALDAIVTEQGFAWRAPDADTKE